MLKGTLLHLVFQEALKTQRFEPEYLHSVADKALGSNAVLNDLILLGIDETTIRKEIGALLASVKIWAEKMVAGVDGKEGEKEGEFVGAFRAFCDLILSVTRSLVLIGNRIQIKSLVLIHDLIKMIMTVFFTVGSWP